MSQLGQTISMYQNLTPQNTNIQPVAFSANYTDLNNGHSEQYSDVLNVPTRVSQFANDASYDVKGEPVSEFANDKQYTVNGSNVSQFANDKSYTVNGSNISQFANDRQYTANGSNVSQFANDKSYTVSGSNISQFSNNSNYAIRGENVSEFNNNAGYITASQVPSSGSGSYVTSGVAGGPGSLPANSNSGGYSVSFGHTYNNPPVVVASCDGNALGNNYYAFNGSGGQLTTSTTGFNFGLYNNSTNATHVYNILRIASGV